MELWRFFDITHREHTYCKPVSVDKVDELIALLRLGHGDRALENATGKGEFVIRLTEQYDIPVTHGFSAAMHASRTR